MALFCLATAAVFHYVPTDANMMIHFMKNIAMAGGFLQLVAWGSGRLERGRPDHSATGINRAGVDLTADLPPPALAGVGVDVGVGVGVG